MTVDVPLHLLPNLLSGARIAMTPIVCTLLWRQAWAPALGWLLVAALTDLVDGWLARRQGWQSSLGALLDPLADKILVLSVAATLWWLSLLPAWLLVLVVLRDLVILSGAAIWRYKTGELRGEPLLLGKLATLALLALLLVVPAWQMAGLPADARTLAVMHWLVAAMLVSSGTAYVVTWWAKWQRIRETT